MISGSPGEIGRVLLSGYYESDIELFFQAYDVRGLHLDGILRRRNRGREEQQCCRIQELLHIHHQFLSFWRDFWSAAFSFWTLSLVSFSRAWMAFSICWAC